MKYEKNIKEKKTMNQKRKWKNILKIFFFLMLNNQINIVK